MRERVLYNLIVFALLMIGAAILMGSISVGVERIILVNLGLSAISVFGLLIAIFIGIGLVSKEIQRRTIYNILSKPVIAGRIHPGKICRADGDTFCQHRNHDSGLLPRPCHSEGSLDAQDLSLLSPSTSFCSNWPLLWGWRSSSPAFPRRYFPPFSLFASLSSATFPVTFAGSDREAAAPSGETTAILYYLCPISATSM